jgi:CCR4-NOT transcriptional regulation complex NOT5 subunit
VDAAVDQVVHDHNPHRKTFVRTRKPSAGGGAGAGAGAGFGNTHALDDSDLDMDIDDDPDIPDNDDLVDFDLEFDDVLVNSKDRSSLQVLPPTQPQKQPQQVLPQVSPAGAATKERSISSEQIQLNSARSDSSNDSAGSAPTPTRNILPLHANKHAPMQMHSLPPTPVATPTNPALAQGNRSNLNANANANAAAGAPTQGMTVSEISRTLVQFDNQSSQQHLVPASAQPNALAVTNEEVKRQVHIVCASACLSVCVCVCVCGFLPSLGP